MTTWLDVPTDHPFGIDTLPYGVFSTDDAPERRVGVRIGDLVLDAGAVAAVGRDAGLVGDGPDLAAVWQTPSLNAFLSLGRPAWTVAREWLNEILRDDVHRAGVEPHLIPLDRITLHLPVEVADYVDFYASEHHASNVGQIFRPDNAALPPNWKHLPIGYHGRAGTVVVSGTDVVRPSGQRKGPQDPAPVFGPSIRLDIEAELGYVVGGATELGSRVSVDAAADHLFGVVILNDWSARDIQAWEYVPLGPFLGKSFATSVSAWVTPLEALHEARVPLPGQADPPVLPYLQGDAFGLDVHVEVSLNGTVVSRPEHSGMYWSPAQMLAHLTVNGASLRDGDLFGSGTISGPSVDSRGSLLELTWNGTEPLTLPDGSTRGFLEDGDTVTMTAWAPGPGGSRIGLGEVTGTIRPALPLEA
ncbi:fumarylacetoacetate hydrolase [Humibacillus xanthopallidus]|uniref:fumarylacetoacetase n=1 Tax=Humibacillus xanthopallidus TaxID=412689 RepID=A0A543PWS9_9MICO|nr:fumarylacetoacetase [Humibacillus xanthopallidus]TQN48533.1 fumarylacetoacetate hydrolase [Humibacillus xanthopallidus]